MKKSKAYRATAVKDVDVERIGQGHLGPAGVPRDSSDKSRRIKTLRIKWSDLSNLLGSKQARFQGAQTNPWRPFSARPIWWHGLTRTLSRFPSE
jgi:hypothetical protein